MSKFSELASKMKSVKDRLEGQADDLSAELDKVASEGDDVIRRHSKVLSDVKAGIVEMRDSLRDLEGNGEPEGEQSNIATFQPGGVKTLGTG